MQLQITGTITLTEDQLKEVVADYVTKMGYPAKADNVDLRIGKKTVGYFDTHDYYYLKDCVVTYQTETKKI